MAEDLVKQLQEQAGSDHMRGCQGRQYSCDCGYDLRTEGLLEQAAASLAEKDKEIERLRSDKSAGFAFWRATAKRFADARRAALSRAEQAGRALAEAVEVIARDITALDEADAQIEYLHGKFKPTGSGANVLAKIDIAATAARAFVAQHGSDSSTER